jgi:hypothetical protein
LSISYAESADFPNLLDYVGKSAEILLSSKPSLYLSKRRKGNVRNLVRCNEI